MCWAVKRKSDTTNINVFQKVIAEDKKKEMISCDAVDSIGQTQ